jgi:hypothetical protein
MKRACSRIPAPTGNRIPDIFLEKNALACAGAFLVLISVSEKCESFGSETGQKVYLMIYGMYWEWAQCSIIP